MTELHDEAPAPQHPPAFNVPGLVLIVLLTMALIHAALYHWVGPRTYYWALSTFAFFPIAYASSPAELVQPLARFWSPVTYGLLHGDWAHLGMNAIWFLAFGSAVARRFGNIRTVVFLVLATAAGALAHLIFHFGEANPMIGASGAVSACMGAAIRFAFRPGQSVQQAAASPALPLLVSLQNRGMMTFIAIWFALNFLFGSGVVPIAGADAAIAWEAHMGGFLFGWLLFGFFDPLR